MTDEEIVRLLEEQLYSSVLAEELDELEREQQRAAEEMAEDYARWQEQGGISCAGGEGASNGTGAEEGEGAVEEMAEDYACCQEQGKGCGEEGMGAGMGRGRVEGTRRGGWRGRGHGIGGGDGRVYLCLQEQGERRGWN